MKIEEFRSGVWVKNEVVQVLSVSHPTAGKLISEFERLEILTEVTGNQRYRLYSFEEYYQLFWRE